jgi:hypothetical protein
MLVGPLVDETGQDFRLNDAFIRAVALLERLGEDRNGEAAS